jgi:hypothetical protein
MLAFLAGACGCLQGEPESPIVVKTPVVDLGLIRGTRHSLDQPFTLRAWDVGPVTITKIDTQCCGAGPVRPDLTGQQLAAGSSHVVFLKMDRSSVGPWTITANVFTDPPAPQPITMTLNAVLSGVPVVAPERLVVDQVPGEKATPTLRVSYMRTQQEDALELDRQACDFSPFVLGDVETRTELVPGSAGQPGPPRWDQLVLQLSLERTFPVGEHRFNLHVALKHGLTAPSALATVLVRHPCRPAVSRLFLGELTPGEKLERQVALVRSGNEKVAVASVDASSGSVEGTIDQVGDTLRIRAVASERPGRFEANLTLMFTEPSVPAASLAVAGIVKERSR